MVAGVLQAMMIGSCDWCRRDNPRTDTKVTEPKTTMVALPELPTVEKVASTLNALGVTPRDMITIFQAMKQAGALQAELIPQ